VGRKVVGSLNTRLKDSNLNYTGSFFDMPDTITAKTANEISEEMLAYFLSGEVDKIEMVYNRFINLLVNEPSVKTLLPLSPVGIEDPEDETFKLTSEDGTLKVADFGFCRCQAGTMTKEVATRWYKAPELLFGAALCGLLKAARATVLRLCSIRLDQKQTGV